MDEPETSFRLMLMDSTEIPSAATRLSPHLRELLYLAEQSAEGKISVLPSTSWGLHYTADGEHRREAVKLLLEGKMSAEEAAGRLAPDALCYDVSDIEKRGLTAVSARIRMISSVSAYQDYQRYATFLASMAGKDIDLQTLQTIYEAISSARIQKRLLDAYGETGRKQLDLSLSQEYDDLNVGLSEMKGLERLMAALRMKWIASEAILPTRNSDLSEKLTQLDAKLLMELQGDFSTFVETGSNEAFHRFADTIASSSDDVKKVQDELTPEMERLSKELDAGKKDSAPRGTKGDKAIPPDDEDEYIPTPPDLRQQTGEGMKSPPVFEIVPSGSSTKALVGYYASGRKSYYDREAKTWSKRKRLSPYANGLSGTERQTISGVIDEGLKALSLPNGYAVDADSLKAKGAEPLLFRDQNGCFYVQADHRCSFSVDFLKEESCFVGLPVAEDTEPLYDGALSQASEAMLGTLQTTDSVQAAERIRSHVFHCHHYPSGKDPRIPQALQNALRDRSDSDLYIQTLDHTDYLECYSANTLFVALSRKKNIPARLIVGHKIESAHEGKAVIDSSTAHAWAEIWDGTAWRRMDATPAQKEADKDDEKSSEKSSPTHDAEDNGVEFEEKGGPQGTLSQQVRKRIKQRMDSLKNEEVGESSTEDVATGKKALQQAKDDLATMETVKKELQEKIAKEDSFEKLEKLQSEIDRVDLLADMKKELHDLIESKKNGIKEDLNNNLDAMEQDGFMDHDKKDVLSEALDDADASSLDALRQEIEKERKSHHDYECIRDEMMPLVEHWYRYFVEHLPREHSVEIDEDSRTRTGTFDRRSIASYRNLVLGTVRNPRIILPSLKPRFLANILLDVSGSMKDDGKLQNSLKLLVFYAELFSRIGREFGYIRFSINIFADNPTEIKTFEQDYDSSIRYEYPDGMEHTVKSRLMTAVQAKGSTDILSAMQKSAEDLRREVFEFPDYLSALYMLGDGEDQCGNKANIQKFLQSNDEIEGFGHHLRSAILLGTEQNKAVLADLFGDEHTAVAEDLQTLVEQSMRQFAIDIEGYVRRMSV